MDDHFCEVSPPMDPDSVPPVPMVVPKPDPRASRPLRQAWPSGAPVDSGRPLHSSTAVSDALRRLDALEGRIRRLEGIAARVPWWRRLFGGGV